MTRRGPHGIRQRKYDGRVRESARCPRCRKLHAVRKDGCLQLHRPCGGGVEVA